MNLNTVGGYIRDKYSMEQKLALLKIKESIGKIPPHELGKLFRDYHKMYLEKADTPKPYVDTLEVFDGGLFAKEKGAKLISQK